MTDWEYVLEEINIPKELYDRISKFSDVEKTIITNMTEWVEIMENNEKKENKTMITKKFGIDFDSKGGALTLDPEYVGYWEVGCKEVKKYSKTHENGWTITAQVHEDYYHWINSFKAEHPELGKVRGDFEHEVFADSEEGYQDFYSKFPPEPWDYGDI